MSLFCFKTDNTQNVVEWLKATKKRGKDKGIVKNPFHWRIKSLKKGNQLYCIVEAKPVYFNYSWFGWIIMFSVWFIWGYHWIMWPSMAIGLMGVFWTAEPVYYMAKRALRKHEYFGPIKRLKYSELIKEALL